MPNLDPEDRENFNGQMEDALFVARLVLTQLEKMSKLTDPTHGDLDALDEALTSLNTIKEVLSEG